ncbi:hypothetical protein [Hydrogenivirga sp. 128-5-R1-1]|uniref:hypothetical protein n=1 Tax=Hydrogenivirga sp. 128-5-R1-1 TaxID=392423 RepID=UPI00015EF87C|nr:hypothetical protein [Hydrogenivirga sp. 128-5-R1-1]EDP75733.1 hypothetical protein HG1285_17255 [Hydrogenivirga sp. 128-5-R1-1]
MEVLLKINLEYYEIREYPDAGTILMFKRGMDGEPDYAVEGEGFVMEFKDGMVYTIDIYMNLILPRSLKIDTSFQ